MFSLYHCFYMYSFAWNLQFYNKAGTVMYITFQSILFQSHVTENMFTSHINSDHYLKFFSNLKAMFHFILVTMVRSCPILTAAAYSDEFCRLHRKTWSLPNKLACSYCMQFLSSLKFFMKKTLRSFLFSSTFILKKRHDHFSLIGFDIASPFRKISK